MAGPQNDPAAGSPFFSNMTMVQVVRHVRVTASGEIVAEDAQALTRYFSRAASARTYPSSLVAPNPFRQVPDIGNLKKAY